MINSSRSHLVILAIALLLTGLWIASGKRVGTTAQSIQLSEPVSGPQRTKAQSARDDPPAARELTIKAATMIPPEEWESRFRTEYQDVDPEIRSEIVVLAGELKNSITGGLDPDGEEARAYGETILVLLAESTHRK